MHEALVGAAESGTEGGAGRGDIGAGLQMADTGVAPEVTVETTLPPPTPPPPTSPKPPRPEGCDPEDEPEEEEEEEPVLEMAGGVNWPLLSEPGLSRHGEEEGFFLTGRTLALVPVCCCCRHLALRFLNHTWTLDSGKLILRATSSRIKMSG